MARDLASLTEALNDTLRWSRDAIAAAAAADGADTAAADAPDFLAGFVLGWCETAGACELCGQRLIVPERIEIGGVDEMRFTTACTCVEVESEVTHGR